MFTPYVVTVLAQIMLALLCAGLGVWAIDPFGVMGGVPYLHDRSAYAIAFYVTTATAAVALPRLRRNDIALIGLALASFLESTRAIVGQGAGLFNLAAAAAGVIGAWAPTSIEQMRRNARLYPFLSFKQIHDLQRRGVPARSSEPAWPGVESSAT